MSEYINILITLFVIILSVFIGFSIISFVDKNLTNSNYNCEDGIYMKNNKLKENKNQCKCKILDGTYKKKVNKENKENKENFSNNTNLRQNKWNKVRETNKFINSNILTAENYYQNKYYYPFIPFNEIVCNNFTKYQDY